jgi:segregation and condensation protein B
MDGPRPPTVVMSDPIEPADAQPVDGREDVSPPTAVPAASDGGSAAEITPRRIVEALLFATDTPLPAAKIAQVLGVGTARDVRDHVAALNETYERIGAVFRIEEIAGGYQMLTLPEFNVWLGRLLRARQDGKLSGAALETLAIVAYKQPVTRAEIESIRGVAAGDLLARLRDLNLVKIVGRAEDLGRPLLYGTTRRFLEVFGLGSLEDLPKVESLREGLKGAGNVSEYVPPPSVDSIVESDDAAADSAPPDDSADRAPDS